MVTQLRLLPLLRPPPGEGEEEGVLVGRKGEGRDSARRAHQPGLRCLWVMREVVGSGVRVPPSLRRRAEVW